MEEENKQETVEAQEEIQPEPKTELTEEEAKTAAENVKQLVKLMDQYKSITTRRQERKTKYEELLKDLPENHYKRKQLQEKIDELEKKINPTIVWDSKTKGTYIKEAEQSPEVSEEVSVDE